MLLIAIPPPLDSMRQTAFSSPGTSRSAFTWGERQNLDSEDASNDQQAAELPDPFYDEHADSEDERWVARNLLHFPSTSVTHPSSTDKSKVPGSIPVSCPSCFSILSMQTQQHIRFQGQFRAVFVTNCKTVTSQRLRVKGEQQSDTQIYQPVACLRCLTEVGVRDQNGVYHFCNVMY